MVWSARLLIANLFLAMWLILRNVNLAIWSSVTKESAQPRQMTIQYVAVIIIVRQGNVNMAVEFPGH